MTVDTNLMLTIAGWITAIGVIWSFLKKIIKPVQNMNEAITLMQRERMESAHAIYSVVLGWCPSGEKTVLSDIYRHYRDSGHNHMAEDYIDRICALPDHPKSNPREEAMSVKGQ